MGYTTLRAYSVTLDDSTAGSRKISFLPYKAGLNTFATSSDWTPGAADFKVAKAVTGSGLGAEASIGTAPTWVNGRVVIILSGTELTCRYLTIRIENAAINSDEIIVETYGNASAQYPNNYVDGVRLGLTALPNAAANGAAGLPVIGTGSNNFKSDSSANVTAASVTGAVGSVTGAVGSVTGNVGGNIVGSVASVTGNVGGNVSGNVSGSVASVTGAVGSVTGAVGSVTGDVGGKVIGGGSGTITGDGVRASSVTGSVGSVTGAVGSVTGAVGSVTGGVGGDVSGKVLGGGSGTISGDGVRASSVTGAVASVTGNVGGNVTGSVGSVVGAVGSVTGNVGGNVTGSVGSISGVTFPANFSIMLIDADGRAIVDAHKVHWTISGTTQTVYRADNTTSSYTKSLTTDANAVPVTGN